MRKTMHIGLAVLVLLLVFGGIVFYYWRLSFFDEGGLDYAVIFGEEDGSGGLLGVPSDGDKNYRDKTVYINRELGFQVVRYLDWDVIEESEDRVSISSSDFSDGRAFVVEITDLDLDDWIYDFEVDGNSKVYLQRDESFAGYSAVAMKASTPVGLDLSIFYVERGNKRYIVKYHSFNKIHDEMIAGFMFIEDDTRM